MAAKDCFIPRDKLTEFVAHVEGKGYATRPFTPSTSVLPTGIQVNVGKHWHSVVYNKNFKRYTADIRLKDFVVSFCAILTASQQGAQNASTDRNSLQKHPN